MIEKTKQEIWIICIDYGYDGWRISTYDNEKKAVERVKKACGSPFRMFRGVELDLSFRESYEIKNRGK